MTEAEVIDRALVFLRTSGVGVPDNAPAWAVWQPADVLADYDRWWVIFELDPEINPSRCLVEVKPPAMTVSIIPIP